jgi:hypothetical protein
VDKLICFSFGRAGSKETIRLRRERGWLAALIRHILPALANQFFEEYSQHLGYPYLFIPLNQTGVIPQ